MKDFRGLTVWQRSHELALAIYRATGRFPKSEIFGLTSQIRRAGLSIPSNLAEGCGRGSDQDFARFVQIAFGSASEVDYQLLFCRDIGLLAEETYASLSSMLTEIKRMLSALLKKLKTNDHP